MSTTTTTDQSLINTSFTLSSIIHQLLNKWQNSSRHSKTLIIILTGVSLTVLAAGVVLRQRRRRYRGVVSSHHSVLRRLDTFEVASQTDRRSNHRRIGSFPSPVPEIFIESDDDNKEDEIEGAQSMGRARRSLSLELMSMEYESLPVHQDSDIFLSLSQNNFTGPLSDDYFDATDLANPYAHSQIMTTPTSNDYLSDSDDSFVSATQSISSGSMKHGLYISALKEVEKGKVECRTLRTEILGCTGDNDFLAKLHCIRLALSDLLSSSANRDYITAMGRDLIVSILVKSQQDPQPFIDKYMDIIQYCGNPDNWEKTSEELKERGVVYFNVFDVALDFLLLDAFDDLSNPPSALVSVIQNGWISDGIKQSMLNTAVWSILKTKKSLLKNRDGFMSRFYSLSETISPVFAWGFLGSNNELHQHCQRFKMTIMKFLQSIFSFETVRYSTVHTLADDIMNHIRRAVASLSDLCV